MFEWGVELHHEIATTLRIDRTALYAESAALDGSQFGGLHGKAFVWPLSTQFRVLNSLVRADSQRYAGVLRRFINQMHDAYWSNGYRSGAGASERFYDDSGHVLIAYAETYRLTDNPLYLERAIATYDFVLEGEDSRAGGGIYFREGDREFKDTISTLQGARGAAMLFQATGERHFLKDAKRLMGWANSRVQLPNGLFNQGYDIENKAAVGVEIVNSAGDGISANIELYDAISDKAY